MDGDLILKRDDTQEASAKLRDGCPEAKTIVLLRLAPQRRLNDANTHLLRKIWALRQNLVLEVRGKLEIRHSSKPYQKFVSTGSVKSPAGLEGSRVEKQRLWELLPRTGEFFWLGGRWPAGALGGAAEADQAERSGQNPAEGGRRGDGEAAHWRFFVSSVSFPKLAQRFGNARLGETLSALQANDGLGRAPEALPPATEMEFRL